MKLLHIERIRGLLDELALDALLVADLVNVRWLSGFPSSNAMAVVTPERAVLVTDFRYTAGARRAVTGLEVVEGKRDLLADVAALLPPGRVGFEDRVLTVAEHTALSELLDGRELVPVGEALERVRAVKTPAELDRIAAAAALADDALRAVLERGVVGRRESDVAADIEAEIRRRGAQRASFSPIVAAGVRTDSPHSEPTDAVIERNTLLLIDWGAELDGWCSDGTRTFATGALSDEMAAVYEAVRAAQAAGLSAVRAGVAAADADGAARAVVAAGGFGDAFRHGLGHGVGMKVHEKPLLTQSSEDVLAAGNVFSVEPGVYLEARFGVRIEDIVAVTDDGVRNFSSLGKELTVVA